MIRNMMWAVLAVGAVLIAAPLAIGLPDKVAGMPSGTHHDTTPTHFAA